MSVMSVMYVMYVMYVFAHMSVSERYSKIFRSADIDISKENQIPTRLLVLPGNSFSYQSEATIY